MVMLILYGEYSSSEDTRNISRLLLYTYMFSVMIPMMIAANNHAYVAGMLTHIVGLLLCIQYSRKDITLVLIILMMVIITLMYFTLVVPSTLQELGIVAQYSSSFYREGLLLLVASTTSLDEEHSKRDSKLNMFAASVWIVGTLITI